MPDSERICECCEKRTTKYVLTDESEPVCLPCAVDLVGAERDNYREALRLVAQHAELDATERGIAEAYRYHAIATHALERT